jgi:hypothetical protein
VNQAVNRRAQNKDNLGVLEATGTMIVDKRAIFDEMRQWSPADITAQMTKMTSAITPEENAVAEFENVVQELIPC